MTSEIDKIAREIGKKPATEIEKIALEIKGTCNNFIELNEHLIESGKELSSDEARRMDNISNVLKDFYVKSVGIVTAWRLNEEQFEEGRIERDNYERRIRELTEDISSLKFDFNKCLPEIESFERQIKPTLRRQKWRTRSLGLQEDTEPPIKSEEKSLESQVNQAKPKQTFGDPEAAIRIGISYLKSKRPDKAKEYLESSLRLKPTDAVVWFYLGRANAALDDHREAIRCFQKALEINSKHAAALCDLGFSFGRLGNHKQASKCYKKLVDISPNDPKAWTGLGTAYYNIGRLKQAKQSLEKAVQIDPKFAIAWHNLGLVYSFLGYPQESERCYSQAEKLGYTV